MVDTETQDFLRAKYNPDGSVLRRAQLRMLEMLKFLDKVCKENNIEYWLDCGNLLGAARHGGYIPWDDDTDVCMTSENLKRFKHVMREKYSNSEFVVQDMDNDPNYYIPWPKLRDTKSEYIGGNQFKQKYLGLQIDLFEMKDYNVVLFQKITHWLNYKIYLINVPAQKYEIYLYIRPICKTMKFLHYKVLVPFLKFISKPFKKNYLTYGYGSEFYGHNEHRYFKNLYPLGVIQFEGYTFPAPHDVEKSLTLKYGNWKELPDLDNLSLHSSGVRFL